MQATFWIYRVTVLHCFSASARHAFTAAATSANLLLHASERFVRFSLTQVAIRPPPGSTLAQAFLMSAAQAPVDPVCAIALDTNKKINAAEVDRTLSILILLSNNSP